MKRKFSIDDQNECKDIPENELPEKVNIKAEGMMPVKPKRPQTAYFLFLADYRIKIKDVKLKEGERIPTLAAKEWQNMSDLEKKPYADRLAADWKKYEEELTNYRKELENMKNETKSPNTSQTNVQNSQLKVFEQNANYDSEVLSLDIKDVESQEPFNIHFEKEQKLNDSDVQCVCCGAVLSEDFAIWFRHRYYCCKECLPEETSRGYRLGKIIKSGGNYLERKDRRQQKSSIVAVVKEMTNSCPTPGCNGKGHISGKYSSHRGVLSCPLAQKETKKKLSNSSSSDSKEAEQSKCPTRGCDGSGHIKGGMFSSHRSLYGCPRRYSKEFDSESRGSPDSSISSPTESKEGCTQQNRGRGRAQLNSDSNSADGSNEILIEYDANNIEKSCFVNDDLALKNNPKRARGRTKGKVRSNSKEELWDITEGDGGVIKLRRKATTLRCEFPGCNGEGHVTGKFVKHRSLYGCPLAAKLSKEIDGCPYPGCDGGGHVVSGLNTHDSLSGCPLVANVMVPSDAEVRCPIPSCDGRGHITGKFSTHRSATACPRAALLIEGKISYSSANEEEILKSLIEKNPDSFAKLKNASSNASLEEDHSTTYDEVMLETGIPYDSSNRIKKTSPSKNEDPFVTSLKEVAILESVNKEFEKTNLSLQAKVGELETECKSITDEVLHVKTEEEKLRDEYKVLKRKILYALSRVDLNCIGIKQSSYEFDGLIEMLNIAFKKQKTNYEIVVKQIEKAMSLTDL